MSNKTLTLGIINHRYANIHSVKKALEYINCNYTELNNPSEFNKVDAIILPGVGAFDAAMQVLNESGMSDALLEANNRKTPIFGICLGMQLLFNKSEEGKKDGLGLIDGEVKKIKQINDLKIPHMGWNKVSICNFNHSLSSKLANDLFYYFVHSYHFVPDNFNDCLAFTDYGEHVTAIIARDNKIGTQFHPEKSQKAGLNLISAFLNWHI